MPLVINPGDCCSQKGLSYGKPVGGKSECVSCFRKSIREYKVQICSATISLDDSQTMDNKEYVSGIGNSVTCPCVALV